MVRRSLAAALLPALLTGLGCASAGLGPTGRQPVPPNSPPVQQELGQRDVVQGGPEYARQSAIVQVDRGDTEEVRFQPNYWRVRFAAPEAGSGSLLALSFDELAQRVTGARRLDITAAPVPTTDSAFRPSIASPATGGSGGR